MELHCNEGMKGAARGRNTASSKRIAFVSERATASVAFLSSARRDHEGSLISKNFVSDGGILATPGSHLISINAATENVKMEI
jgi:hypothetical protein